jgi:hypothetical protein
MKRALIAIASVGVFAVTVGVDSANAQTYSPYGAPRSYTSRAYTPPKPRLPSPQRSAHCSAFFQPGQSGSHGRW